MNFERQTKRQNYDEILSFTDKCFCILCHCDNDEKIKKLIKLLNKIKSSSDLPIFLISHFPIPESIQNKVDYYLYNRNNPIFNIDLNTEQSIQFNYILKFTKMKYMCFKPMYYHSYAHYLQIFDAIGILFNQRFTYAYILNYDIPESVIDNINEYCWTTNNLIDNDVVHFNYEIDNCMSTELFFCKVQSVHSKIKNIISVNQFEKFYNGPNGASFESVFKTMLGDELNFYNLGNYENTQGKPYIGEMNYNYKSNSKIDLLHSNIDDLIIIPHVFEDKKFLAMKNTISPRAKEKVVKIIFYDKNFCILNEIIQLIDILKSYRFRIPLDTNYCKLFIDDDDKVFFDVLDDKNFGYINGYVPKEPLDLYYPPEIYNDNL